ncbi:hypothetical protein CDAR_304531 [Caerostris darwini]|uniref:Uncharacterized protein n=1 Tax=Caerostris darwini TaxID=1538125 RepID=A0AAV4NJJ5_9ARAC|nr:hypothetical protein CDAR_304531 [Caerostris darwini]
MAISSIYPCSTPLSPIEAKGRISKTATEADAAVSSLVHGKSRFFSFYKHVQKIEIILEIYRIPSVVPRNAGRRPTICRRCCSYHPWYARGRGINPHNGAEGRATLSKDPLTSL